MQRAIVYVFAGCAVAAATAFLAVYTAVTAFTDMDWPD